MKLIAALVTLFVLIGWAVSAAFDGIGVVAYIVILAIGINIIDIGRKR